MSVMRPSSRKRRSAARRGPRCPWRPADAKCDTVAQRFWGQAALRHRCCASPSGRTSGCPHDGHTVGELPLRQPLGAQLEHRADHLGDDVARLAHDDGVARAHVLVADLVLVVQRGQADGGAAHEDRLEHRERGGLAGAADGDLDVTQDRGALLGRQLERDGPAGGLGGRAQGALHRQVVDLHHDAVDLVGQLVAGSTQCRQNSYTESRSSKVRVAGLTGTPSDPSHSSAPEWLAGGSAPTTSPSW